MENQVQDTLNKAMTEPNNSAWSAQATLVPKKSQDGNPKYRLC